MGRGTLNSRRAASLLMRLVEGEERPLLNRGGATPAVAPSQNWCETEPNRTVSSTRGLLATDHVILNHGQVTWTTPELAPPSPNYHTTPTGGRFSSRQIQRASLPYTAGLWWYWDRTHDMPAMVGNLNHWATAAPLNKWEGGIKHL
ncbi:hypothetical protein TNCV_4043811 [Trichonephila clavipes]|nr:hypothetical protein TNCV_4043811 [Trichonephila clavipes]